MNYQNNDFGVYVNLVHQQHNYNPDDRFLLKLVKVFPVLVWRTLKDAGVELMFLLAFWCILVKMSQGRDLVVSLFEPEGLYGKTRILFTALAVISLSVSMWIIPAYLFQKRELATKSQAKPQFPFQEHLFFMHRTLPLIPFWLLAAVLFNGFDWLFVFLSIAQMALLYYLNQVIVSHTMRRRFVGVMTVALIILFIYFFNIFQQQYNGAKVVLTIILYLLAMIMFQLYNMADNSVLAEHSRGVFAGQTLKRKYKLNTILYYTVAAIHLVVILLIVFMPFSLGIAPESMLLYMFSVYVFVIDLAVYMINISKKRQVVAAVIGLIIFGLVQFNIWKVNVSQYTMDANDQGTAFTARFRDNFADRYAALKEAIDANPVDSTPYPIILVSGEGGGSRAGMWFSQNLINFDYATGGKFRNHVFSMSTVSGSSVGLGTVLTFWDHTRNDKTIDSNWVKLPAAIYANNFVGGSIRGLLLTDLCKSIFPGRWTNDRNSILQDEEADATARAILQVKGDPHYNDCELPRNQLTLKRDFMSFFYDKVNGQMQYRPHTPIVLINTCRSNDGRRGVFSSIRMRESYFNEALDLAGYLYEDSICFDNGIRKCMGHKKPISLGQACNTSELFPMFSAPVYIDSLGSFVDGGYHENSGLKSTLDIYQQLKTELANNPPSKKYKIYILYLKNGSAEKQLYKALRSEATFFQPLRALFNQPFEGSASYFEEKAKCISDIDSNCVAFVPVYLESKVVTNPNITGIKGSAQARQRETEILKDLITDIVPNADGTKDTLLNFPLARWLSKTVINRIQMCAIPENQKATTIGLLNAVKQVNSVSRTYDEPFKNYPVHQELKVEEADLKKKFPSQALFK